MKTSKREKAPATIHAPSRRRDGRLVPQQRNQPHGQRHPGDGLTAVALAATATVELPSE